MKVDGVAVRHAALLLLAYGAACATGWAWIASVGIGVAFAFFLWGRRDQLRRVGFGVANRVTAVRGGLVIALGVVEPAARWSMVAVALAVFVLDAVDGWWARRTATASTFGAEFDMEVDAAYVAVLSVCLWREAVGGAWILVPGALRYVYVLTIAVLGKTGDSPRSRLTRYAFAILVSGLIVGLMPLGTLSSAAALFGTLVVSYSFALSFWAAFKAPRAHTQGDGSCMRR